MRHGLLIAALICVACSSGSTSEPAAALAPAVSAPNVQAILAGVKAKYKNTKTYSDEGTFRSVRRTQGDKDVRRSKRERSSIPAEALEHVPAEAREKLANRPIEPSETEDTIEFNSTFDAPIDAKVFATVE